MKAKSMMWAAAPLLLALTATAAKAQTSTPAPGLDPYGAVSESLPWSFAGSPDDGAEPETSLIADKSGNLYGTTLSGGTNSCPPKFPEPGCGTVFELSPPHGKSPQWSERVLYSFGSTSGDGANPEASLIADKSGNLYGTTSFGGANDFGTVFELSPPYGKSPQWSERVLHSFAGGPNDGAEPEGSLLADKSGNLYGTTQDGGANPCSGQGCGTVFELSPPYSKSSTWSERVLYNFAGGPDDGAAPVAGLLADKSGNLYGTTVNGGANCSPDGCGTVFELNPPYGKSPQWSEQVLWNFAGGPNDGATPTAALLADQRGDLYSTTFTGGADGVGTVFELSPPYGKSPQWSEQVLWQFGTASDDGELPFAGLLADQRGNLYGTTELGGTDGNGTVFELSPPYGKSPQWSEQVLWSFAGSPEDGATPSAALLADKSGNLYGTTLAGGANDDGTVFELSLPY